MNDIPELFKFVFDKYGQCYVRIDTNKDVYTNDFELPFDIGEYIGHLLSFMCPVLLIDEMGDETIYYNGEIIGEKDTKHLVKIIKNYINGKGDDKMNQELEKEMKKIEEIREIREEINEFANADQYSVNNPYVKSLYRRLRELEGREQIKEDKYVPQFIGDSDVPINGRYE